MSQPIQPMPQQAAQILQEQLIQLLNHTSSGEVVSFAFAAELVVEDETGEAQQRTYYGNFQITDSLLAMITKLQALVVAKSLRVERPIVEAQTDQLPGPKFELTDEILATVNRLNAQVTGGIIMGESDHPDVENTDPSLQS